MIPVVEHSKHYDVFDVLAALSSDINPPCLRSHCASTILLTQFRTEMQDFRTDQWRRRTGLGHNGRHSPLEAHCIVLCTRSHAICLRGYQTSLATATSVAVAIFSQESIFDHTYNSSSHGWNIGYTSDHKYWRYFVLAAC